MYVHLGPDTLFYGDTLANVLNHQTRACMRHAVEAIPAVLFLKQSVDWLTKSVMRACAFQPLKLQRDSAKMSLTGARSGYRLNANEVEFNVPFTGNRELWHLFPDVGPYPRLPPRGTVLANGWRDVDQQLCIPILWRPEMPAEQCRANLNGVLDQLQWFIDAQVDQLAQFHETLEDEARVAVKRRYDELAQREELANALHIQIQDMDTVVPQLVDRVNVAGSPMFEEVLSTIRHAGATFEESPRAYVGFNEADMRQNLRSHLSIPFPGRVTAETMRGKGKTDLLIEDHQSREAVVAECKLWYGGGRLEPAIDQLLSYMAPRDNSAVLVLFNMTVAGFTQLKENIGQQLLLHENALYSIGADYPGEWRYAFRAASDDERMVVIHIFAFNLYVPYEERVKIAKLRLAS